VHEFIICGLQCTWHGSFSFIFLLSLIFLQNYYNWNIFLQIESIQIMCNFYIIFFSFLHLPISWDKKLWALKYRTSFLGKKRMVKKNIGMSNQKSLLLVLSPFYVKGIFSHFTSEFKKNGPQAVISRILENHSQLMKRTYTWWKKIICTSWKMSTHLGFVAITCRSSFFPTLQVNSQIMDPWQ